MPYSTENLSKVDERIVGLVGCCFILKLQWNLDLTKCQGTGEIDSLYRGFVISRFFSIHYTITGLKSIVRYTEGFAI